MIGSAELRRQAERRYREYLASIVENTDVFPVDIRFGKVKPGEVSERYAALRAEIAALREGSVEGGTPSYRIEWEERSDRLSGNQRFPVRIQFPDPASLVGFLRKGREVERFRTAVSALLDAFPGLRAWAARHPTSILSCVGEWERIVAVLRWFVEHPRPGILLREIPAVEDTKFVERNKAVLRELLDLVLPAEAVDPSATVFEDRYGLRRVEPMIRVRFLDRTIAARYLSGLNDLAVPVSGLESLSFPEVRTVLVVENKATFTNVDVFLALPALAGVLAVFGSGFLASSLRAAGWLAERRLLYWGDTDTQGLRILAGLRRGFPQLKSVLMDERTFDRFPDARTDAPQDRSEPPAELGEAEAALYARLARLPSGNRLEQERIPAWWARERLAEAVSGR